MIKSLSSLFILTIMFLISCKNDTKTGEINSSIQKELNNSFKISVNAIVKKDDFFQLYYFENKSENFTEEKSIWVEVKGNDKNQNIVFSLPKDIVPLLVRLDFGRNENQRI